MGLLDGQRAIVTGGGSGIGRATARRLTDEGATVAVLDRNAAAAATVAADVGGHACTADVRDPDALEAALSRAADALGGLTILFNNAGIGAAAPLHGYRPDQWHRIIDVSLTGTFLGIRAAVTLIRSSGGGCIVNNASVSGVRPTRFEAPYSAAKAGVISLTMAAALEYGPTIRVNCVSPGFVRTPLTAIVADDAGARSRLEAATPLGRLGEPDDVANVVVFLASPLAAYVTGHNLVVDGGAMLPNPQADALLERIVAPEGR